MSQRSTTICQDFKNDLQAALRGQESSNIFILCDQNAFQYCYPVLAQYDFLQTSHVITVPAGDEHKHIQTAVKVWEYLTNNGANRQSMLLNLGGGMITDLGGFVASTFKRGIRYINIPTTLLGAVDAATGGKTGINFMGFKNEIGVFNPPVDVLIQVDFLKTLDEQNFRSGFAEMLKHALIDSHDEWNETIRFDLQQPNYEQLKALVARSVHIKERIVEQDPLEKNIRKALNLGHTFGHAFETFSYQTAQPALHGYAVMWGLLCELYVSHCRFQFSIEKLGQLKSMIHEYYGWLPFNCNHYDTLFELMTHDKKNETGEVNVTLLSDIGTFHINQTLTKTEIFEALDFYCNT